jgi:hypothetical protein
MKYLMINTFCGKNKTYFAGQEYDCLTNEDLLSLKENVDYKFTDFKKEEDKENKKTNK